MRQHLTLIACEQPNRGAPVALRHEIICVLQFMSRHTPVDLATNHSSEMTLKMNRTNPMDPSPALPLSHPVLPCLCRERRRACVSYIQRTHARVARAAETRAGPGVKEGGQADDGWDLFD